MHGTLALFHFRGHVILLQNWLRAQTLRCPKDEMQTTKWAVFGCVHSFRYTRNIKKFTKRVVVFCPKKPEPAKPGCGLHWEIPSLRTHSKFSCFRLGWVCELEKQQTEVDLGHSQPDALDVYEDMAGDSQWRILPEQVIYSFTLQMQFYRKRRPTSFGTQFFCSPPLKGAADSASACWCLHHTSSSSPWGIVEASIRRSAAASGCCEMLRRSKSAWKHVLYTKLWTIDDVKSSR